MTNNDTKKEIIKPIIFILGPTAGGKTDLSIELAQVLNPSGEIISADSMQVYKGLDIGTAKPSIKERKNIPHYAIDCVDPNKCFDVEQWTSLAEHHISSIRLKKKWPIICGGTNLYAQAILRGLDKLPSPTTEVKLLLNSMNTNQIYEKLLEVDKLSALAIHPNDHRRIRRSLEIFLSSGIPASELRNAWAKHEIRDDAIVIGLDWDVENINKRINQRVKNMIEKNFLEEVKLLYSRDLLNSQSSSALGYSQIIEHLKGNCSFQDAVEQIKIRTRRLAKQQRTWFSKFKHRSRCHWIKADGESTQVLLKKALMVISRYSDI